MKTKMMTVVKIRKRKINKHWSFSLLYGRYSQEACSGSKVGRASVRLSEEQEKMTDGKVVYQYEKNINVSTKNKKE